MKKVAACAFLLMFLSASNPPECNTESLSTLCIEKLTSGFNFLKTYKIDPEGGARDHVEYSYVFTKGTQYMINVCPEEAAKGNIVVSLYDSQRNQVATSKIDNQVISAIAYPCNATGIYYIQYTFTGDASCGGSALGFKR